MQVEISAIRILKPNIDRANSVQKKALTYVKALKLAPLVGLLSNQMVEDLRRIISNH